MADPGTFLIRAQDVEQLLPICDAIEVLGQAFREKGQGQVEQPERQIVTLYEHSDSPQLLTMSGVMKAQELASVKISTITPLNRLRGLPIIHGLVVVIDLKSGKVTALIEGASLTALRTGAVSGLATKILSRQDSETLAIIGAGVQAKSQALAVCAVRNIKRILVFSRSQVSTATFIDWAQKSSALPREILACNTALEATEVADIICISTSTASRVPVVTRDSVRKGTHINSIGGVNEQAFEFDPELFRGSLGVVEDREAALRESGEVISALQSPYANTFQLLELSDLLLGKHPGRVDRNEITVFRGVGMAMEDTAVAGSIIERARISGMTPFPFF